MFGHVQSIGSGSGTQSNPTGAKRIDATESSDFSSALALRMAGIQAKTFNTLLGAAFGGNKVSSGMDFLTRLSGAQSGSQPGASDPLSLLDLSTAAQGLSPSGRNLSLFDPESAYRMMSAINTRDITYKAQFSELSEMKTLVSGMQQAGQSLGGVSALLDNDAIKTQLQAFAAEYNDWVTRFDGTVKNNGLLAGTQAAEVSLYELEQSVKNIFNGAKDGFHGIRDLGLNIDPNTKLATLDTSMLSAALEKNKAGAISTLQEFSANFARSAELLNSANNFIPNRLGNLDRVIDFIADHKPSLQAEFGLGDPAKPSPQVARALAAYNQIVKT
ncbi:flagellar filament capping protein FliD [Accumulibacter sp.]|uniref:flagellar filament capping protein FliD n=1 Tax=Accumulibacter sp. TaxID=2053492 RepID=UPI0028C3D7F2|nr:flagellar filament capping protein FliD [Accumulibacter sp.]